MTKANPKIAFVILNYMTANETVSCINSIVPCCKNYNYKIYIVDNCSPDKSGESLKKQYRADKNVEVILSDQNIGFARGNNLGFAKAKTEFGADYIILCNSDTEIKTPTFCNQIIKDYVAENYAVLGPKELLKDGSFYPLNSDYPTVTSTKNYIKGLKRRIKAIENPFYNAYYRISSTLKRVCRKIIRVITHKDHAKLDPNKAHHNLKLHGFFLIFSKAYIDQFDGLDDRTFFYGEEDFLMVRLKQASLTSFYDPKIIVFHNRNTATNKSHKKAKSKKLFVLTNQLRSAEILLEELQS